MDFRSHTLPLFHLSKMLTLTDMYNYHIGLLVHSIQFNLFIKHDRSLHKLVRQGTNTNKIKPLILEQVNSTIGSITNVKVAATKILK